jgi:hypothetical protein
MSLILRHPPFSTRFVSSMLGSGVLLVGCAVGGDLAEETIASAALQEGVPSTNPSGTGTGRPGGTGTAPTATVPPNSMMGMASATATGSATASSTGMGMPVFGRPPGGMPSGTASSMASASATSTGFGMGMGMDMDMGTGGANNMPAPTVPVFPGFGPPPGGGIGDEFETADFVEAAKLIDDMEDGDAEVAVREGRGGYWFSFNDGAGTQSLVMNDTCDRDPATSRGCVQSVASEFPEYAGFGFSFDANDAPFDASGFRGLRFHAKGVDTKFVTMSLVTASSEAAAGGLGFETEFAVDSDWQQVNVAFADLQPSNWYTGALVELRSDELVRVEFLTFGGQPHEVFIDDVELY